MTVTLPPEKVSKGLKNIIYDGICSQSLFTLTGGPFLVAFALIMGADNAYIGYITAVSFLSQLIQIPTIYLIEKLGRRKLITIIGSLTSRAMWIVIALMPFFSPQNLLLLLGVFSTSSILANVSACSWNSWMRDLVPIETRGVFFAKRFKLSYALSSTLGILAGLFIDNLGGVSLEILKSYSIIFIIGTIFGLMSVFFITRIPEPAMEKSKFSLELLKQPFLDKNFRKLLSTLGFWSFASNLATPFVAVYKLLYPKVSYRYGAPIFPNCFYKEVCRQAFKENILVRVNRKMHCAMGATLCQYFKLVTNIESDYDYIKFDKSHCIIKCYIIQQFIREEE